VPIKNLNGGKTFPKKGRLGSGAYWPAGVPIAGNIFAPNSEVLPTATPTAPRLFGSPSNAGNNTQFGQNRVTSGATATHPNAGFGNISQQNRVPAMVRNGYTGEFETPYETNPVIQPHERNALPFRKVFGPHHTVSGASRVMPSDTPFHPLPPVQRPKPQIRPQVNVLRVPRSQQRSFVSRNNLWVDPNNSFIGGRPNVHGEIGAGRWQMVKRGAAG
jgi:hypothetical protein